MASSSHKHHPAALIYITVYLACVAGVRKGMGRELGRKTAREGGARRGTFLPRALLRAQIPHSPSPLILTPATQATVYLIRSL